MTNPVFLTSDNEEPEIPDCSYGKYLFCPVGPPPCKNCYGTFGNIKESSAAIRIGDYRIGEMKNRYNSCVCPVWKQHITG